VVAAFIVAMVGEVVAEHAPVVHAQLEKPYPGFGTAVTLIVVPYGYAEEHDAAVPFEAYAHDTVPPEFAVAENANAGVGVGDAPGVGLGEGVEVAVGTAVDVGLGVVVAVGANDGAGAVSLEDVIGHNAGVLFSAAISIPGAIAALVIVETISTSISVPVSMSRYSRDVCPGLDAIE